MKKKLMKVLSILMVGGMLSAAPVFKASALGSFDTIIRAAQAMSVAQMEMKHIGERISMKSQTTIPITIQKPALKVFGVYSYIEHGTVHNDTNETIHRSNLPLSILTYQEGFGNITGVSIDGVPLDSALLSKVQIDDNQDIDNVCAQLIVLDESVISTLKGGSHVIVVNCTDTHGTTLQDSFSFNLVN